MAKSTARKKGSTSAAKKRNAGKKRAVGKTRRVGDPGKTYRPVKVSHCQVVGSVSFHKSQARKQVEEQLAWLLLQRDQAKTKKARRLLSRKVTAKRNELKRLQ